MTRQESVIRYERLRACELQHAPRSRERELFVQCGMVGWLNAWARYAPLRNPSAKPIGMPKAQDVLIGFRVPARNEITEVLATMAWAVVG